MNKVLITGVTGKNGRYLLECFKNNPQAIDGYTFRMLVRESSDTRYVDEFISFCKDLKSAGGAGFGSGVMSTTNIYAEKVTGSIDTEEEAFSFCDGGFDTLLHIAGIQRSVPLVKAALKCGVRRFILVHTTGIYSKYKKAGEGYRQIDAEVTELCSDAGVSLTILRPTMIYGSLTDGNMSVFIKMVDKFRLFPVINGAKYELQPVWCKDLGKAFYDVLMNPDKTDNKEYDLSGKSPILLIDIFKEIGRQLGVKNTFIPVPYPLCYFGAVIVFILSIGKIDFREKVQRMVEPRAYPHDAAYSDFGYTPVSFADGIKDEIEMYKNSKNNR